jgi:hypothetical protein
MLIIKPYVGVGDILLGDTAEQIRSIIREPFRSMKKTPSSVLPSDQFLGTGIIVYYKPPGAAQSIELTPPANPVLFDDKQLLGERVQVVREWLSRHSQETVLDKSSTAYLDVGISLYSSTGISRDESVVESVGVFERGYYDGLLLTRSKRSGGPATD